jgi:hypothetical protein
MATSTAPVIDAPSSRASGSTYGLAFSLSQVIARVCARSVERLRASVGYRVVVRHADYKRFLSRKNGAESLVAH